MRDVIWGAKFIGMIVGVLLSVLVGEAVVKISFQCMLLVVLAASVAGLWSGFQLAYKPSMDGFMLVALIALFYNRNMSVVTEVFLLSGLFSFFFFHLLGLRRKPKPPPR